MRAICSICSGCIDSSIDAMPPMDAGSKPPPGGGRGAAGCMVEPAEEIAPLAPPAMPDTAGSLTEGVDAAAGLLERKHNMTE